MSSIKPDNSAIKVSAINAFTDNYIWAISSQNNTVLVDPGDADVCIQFLEKNQMVLNAILITHHHRDHTGGINKLAEYCQNKQWPLTVYGPAHENISQCDVKLIEKDTVELPKINVSFQVIDLPGHTSGHIAYFTNNENNPLLFCGDTLFSGGCGRLFEGTPKQMLTSLTKLANLPNNTKVYCAHEYTQANLKFAIAVEPSNENLHNYIKEVEGLRENNQATIPTTVELEKRINPFLRSHEATIQASAKNYDHNTGVNSLDAFTTIRRWKDQF